MTASYVLVIKALVTTLIRSMAIKRTSCIALIINSSPYDSSNCFEYGNLDLNTKSFSIFQIKQYNLYKKTQLALLKSCCICCCRKEVFGSNLEMKE